LPDARETIQILISRSDEKFGSQRTDELRADLEQIAADLSELSSAKIEFDDEP
jgi:hypothetical protein